jgi:hypothetical protein
MDDTHKLHSPMGVGALLRRSAILMPNAHCSMPKVYERHDAAKCGDGIGTRSYYIGMRTGPSSKRPG